MDYSMRRLQRSLRKNHSRYSYGARKIQIKESGANMKMIVVLCVVTYLVLCSWGWYSYHQRRRLELQQKYQTLPGQKIGKGRPLCMWNVEGGGFVMAVCEEGK